MKRSLHSTIAFALSSAMTLTNIASAANIESSTITEVVKSANILQPSAKSRKAARVSDVFGIPSILMTGADSRVEMVADDQTVTRVGANTVFSFEPQKREINLQKGSVLFNSPTGKGGGTIRTAAATAAVQGTTLIVVTTKNGGFKVMLLEGHGSVRTAGGKSRSVAAGQMVYALPGGDLSGVLTFHLAEQVGAARLVNGFKKPLASKDKIEAAIAKQEVQIAKGQLVTTGLLASDLPTQAYKVDNTIALDVVREQKRTQVQQITSSAQAGLLDVTITQPLLDRNRIYTAASDIAGLFPGTSVADVPPSTSVFFARNATVRTNAIDLAAYPGTFVFYSTGDFVVDQSFSITGGLDEIGIIASGTIRQKPGAFIDIDAKFSFIYGFGAGTTNGQTFFDGTPLSFVDGGIRSAGSLFLFGSSIDLNRSTLTARNGTLLAFASGDFNAVGLGSNAPQFVAPESVGLSSGNNLSLSNSVTSTLQTNLFATNDMTLTNVAFLTASGPASSVSAHAGNLMTLNGAAFQAQSVSLDSRTLALTNVAFNSQSKVTLRSQTGLLAPNPNTSQPVELGKVNFIRNVTYGGAPAQNAVRGGSITITK